MALLFQLDTDRTFASVRSCGTVRRKSFSGYPKLSSFSELDDHYVLPPTSLMLQLGI